MPDHSAPRVLLLEDDAADALLIEEALDRLVPQARITRAADRRHYLELLAAGGIDLVLSDGTVPGCEGMEAFHLAREHDSRLPFIFVSGVGWPSDPRELRGAGVSATISKDLLDDLGPAVRQALTGTAPDLDAERLRIGYEALLAASRELIAAGDEESLQVITCATARGLCGADGSTFMLRDGEYCRHTRQDPAGPDPAGPDPDGPNSVVGRHAVQDCISGWAIRRRQPAVIDDLHTDPRATRLDLRSATAHSMIVVPIGSSPVIGTIHTCWTQPYKPDATDARLLQILADTAGAALTNLRERALLTERAREQTAELDGLTYAISHDLRAPIRHLSGFTRILLSESTDLSPETQHVSQRISDAAGQLRDMVDGLLTLSRISRADLDRQPVDLAALGRDVAARLAHAAGPDHPVVEFIVSEQLPVQGDSKLLTQLLQQLLGNGWKFTAGVGRPRVELGVQAGWSATESSDHPVFFVRDNGVGFETGSRDRLFGAFQRLHGVEEFPGLGLGLATAKRVVTRHGGTIRGTAAPEQGAVFTFTLPSP